MIRKALLMVCILSLFFAGVAQAAQAAPLKLPVVVVELWPEYDQPSVLVIYHITLPGNISLPATFDLKIPAAAGKPNAVAARQADSTLVNIKYDQQQAGEWEILTITATTPEVQVEYYDPGLNRNTALHTYTYRWPGDNAVDNLTIRIQQPTGASNMDISGGTGVATPETDGFLYYTKQLGAVPAGQSVDLTIKYNKTDNSLSNSSLPVNPSAPISESNSRSPSFLLRDYAWLFIVLGVLLLVGGGYWYWRSGLTTEPATPGRSRRRATARQEEPAAGEASRTASALPQPEPAGGQIYCHNCGKRASPGDRFCRTCGTELRSA